jgi:thymidylate synthase (FAD)
MNVRLIAHTPNPDDVCATAAAVCYNAKDGKRSLAHALASGHDSVAEHAAFTFQIEEVSRVLLAQLTRHRIASFSVQSQRYCGADFKSVMPKSLMEAGLVDECSGLHAIAEALYEEAIKRGVPAEDARYFTLQGGQTKIVMTMNARELRHFFSLRCCNRAQWEIRELADEVLRLCKEVAPILFEDAGPGCVRGKCPEKRPCGNPRGKDAQ